MKVTNTFFHFAASECQVTFKYMQQTGKSTIKSKKKEGGWECVSVMLIIPKVKRRDSTFSNNLGAGFYALLKKAFTTSRQRKIISLKVFMVF